MNNITCFTDEISRDFETAADVLGEKQIREFDLRNMRTGRVPYISLEEEKEVEKLLSCYDYKEPVSEIEKKYQELLETLSPEQEEVITEYCNAIFSSGADTEKFFYRLGLKDGLNLKNTVKSVLEMIS